MLAMQRDGNLVTYLNGLAVAVTNTFVAGSTATVDNIGTIRVIAPNGSTQWTGPATNGSAGIWYLTVQPSGTMLIGPDGVGRSVRIGLPTDNA